jgi:hypothetical protein
MNLIKRPPDTPVVVTPSAITITSTSSEFLYPGETLEITGTNFVNKDYATKIVINDIEISPKLLTNTTLQLVPKVSEIKKVNKIRGF